MSQKINPVSFKLGILQIWSIIFPKYGKSFKSYNRIRYLSINIINYIIQFFQSNKILIDSINIWFINNKTILINIVSFSTRKPWFFNKRNILLKVLGYWIKIPIILNIYKKNTFTNSSFLILNYITFLITQDQSPKKTFQSIYFLVKDQASKIKLIKTVNGFKKVQLKGFKLKFSGCFETSRTQMTKSIKYNFGSLPLTRLNGYTEYSNSTLYTKLGSCGLKIWLFYEFKYL